MDKRTLLQKLKDLVNSIPDAEYSSEDVFDSTVGNHSDGISAGTDIGRADIRDELRIIIGEAEQD